MQLKDYMFHRNMLDEHTSAKQRLIYDHHGCVCEYGGPDDGTLYAIIEWRRGTITAVGHAREGMYVGEIIRFLQGKEISQVNHPPTENILSAPTMYVLNNPLK